MQSVTTDEVDRMLNMVNEAITITNTAPTATAIVDALRLIPSLLSTIETLQAQRDDYRTALEKLTRAARLLSESADTAYEVLNQTYPDFGSHR